MKVFKSPNWQATLPALLFASSVATTVSAETTSCTRDAPCEIDVLVAYTQQALEWTQATQVQPAFSCDRLLNEQSDAIYAKIERKADNEESFSRIEHPCRSDASLGRVTQNTDAGINNLIDIGIAELNNIYNNSELPIRFNLVGQHKLTEANGEPYVEGSWLARPAQTNIGTGRHNDSFAQLISENIAIFGELVKARNEQNTPDTYKVLSQKRAQVGADLVVILVGENYGGTAIKGIATAAGVIDAKNAYTVLQVQDAVAPSFVMTHEVSHLMGAGHYEFAAALDLGAVKLLSLDAANSYGHTHAKAFMTDDKKFATVMGGSADATNLTILPFISSNNISVKINGQDELTYRLGETDAEQNPTRDNANAIQASAALIAQFGETYSARPIIEKSRKVAIDFGYQTFNKVSYETNTDPDDYYGYWNNISNHRRGTKIGGTDNPIKTQSGVETEIELEITSSFSGKNVPAWIVRGVSDFGIDEVPPMAMSDGFYALSNWNSGRLRVSGLNPDLTYTFEFYGSGNSTTQVRRARYEISARDATGETKLHSAVIVTEPNFLRSLQMPGIKPNPDGSVDIRLSGATNWVWHTANLNAMQFWPEVD